MDQRLDPHAALEASVAAAEADCNAGNWQLAFESYVKLLRDRLSKSQPADFESTTLTGADAVVLERTAELAVLLGQTTAADYIFAGLISAFKRADNHFASDCAALKRLHLAISQGSRTRVEQSLVELEPTIGVFDQIAFNSSGLDAWEKERLSWRSAEENNRIYFLNHFYLEAGRLFSWIGQYRDAVNALKRGLALVEKSTDRLSDKLKTSLQLELAASMLEMGEVVTVNPVLRDLKLTISADHQPGYAVRCWELEARRQIMCGEFGHALSSLEIVKEFCRKHGFRHGELTASLNLAELLILVNQTIAARELIATVFETVIRIGDESLRARTERLRRLAEERSRSRRDAILIAPPVSDFWRSQASLSEHSNSNVEPVGFDPSDSTGFLDRFNEYALALQWLLDQRQLRSSNDLLTNIREIFGRSDSRLIQIRLRILDGIQKFYAGFPESAVAALVPVCTELRHLGLKHELWQTCQYVQWSLERLGKTQEGLDLTFAREAENLLVEITASLRPEQRAFFFLNKWTADEDRLSEKLDALIAEDKSVKFLPWPLRCFAHWRVCLHAFDLELECGRIRTEIARENFRVEAIRTESHGIAAFLWRLLSHAMRRATLSFFVFPDRLFIVRSSFLSIRFGVTPVSRGDLREMVRSLHEAFSQGEIARLAALRAAEKVGDVLQFSEMLRAIPKRVRSLTIIPDDALNGVPFAALIANGRPVVESYSVTIQTFLPTKELHVQRLGRLSIIAAGVSEAVANLPPLPGVAKEIRNISDLFLSRGMQVLPLLNADATKANIVKCLGIRSIIHLACHGVFCWDDLERTGLVLHSEDGEFDLVSLVDLANLDLSNVEHLTFSSCWSADNYILPGRWVLSLPQAALVAGAKSVLGNLWPLDDEVATAFARRFYEHFLSVPRDEALRRTQLECLHNTLLGRGILTTADPFYWGGYTLHGRPDRVRFR